MRAKYITLNRNKQQSPKTKKKKKKKKTPQKTPNRQTLQTCRNI